MVRTGKEWFIAALIRAVRTMAQTALSMLTVGMAISDVDWLQLASITIVAGVISILTSLATGLPEATTDGAVVVESLEPGKNYTPQYYMADNNGNEIDAVLANNWDTQFLIALPKPVAKGTKMKLSMLIKADKEASAESQAHGALPKAGAIEGKDGYGGTYMHYALLDNVSFTTDWKQFDKEFTVPDQGDNMQSICFNLDVLREVNKYYFKNIVVRVAK